MPITNKKHKKGKRMLILSLWKMKKKEFWIECITLYISILIAVLFVQAIILKVEIGILIFCLTKSFFTSIINVLLIMLGRQIRFVQKRWFVETIVYTILSIPYVEISIIYAYTGNFPLFLKMMQWYAITYFAIGLGIKKYLKWTKQFFTKILKN